MLQKIAIYLLLSALIATSSSTKATNVFSQLFDADGGLVQETEDLMIFKSLNSTLVYNKQTKSYQNITKEIIQQGIKEASFFVDENNQLYSRSQDLRSVFRVQATTDFQINILETITHPENEGRFRVLGPQHNYITLLNFQQNSQNDSEEIVNGQVYDISEQKITKEFSATAHKNYTTGYKNINANSFVMFTQIGYDPFLQIANLNLETKELKFQKMPYTRYYVGQSMLTSDDLLLATNDYGVEYANLNDPSNAKVVYGEEYPLLPDTSSFLLVTKENATLYTINPNTLELQVSWMADTFSFWNLQYFYSGYSRTRDQIYISLSEDICLWLDPKSGEIVDKFDKYDFWTDWFSKFRIQYAPILTNDYTYDIDDLCITRRHRSNGSLAEYHFIENFGIYKNVSDPTTIRMISRDVNQTGNDGNCSLVTLNVENGVYESEPYGKCLTSPTKVIIDYEYTSIIYPNGDSIYQMWGDQAFNYNGETHFFDLCDYNACKPEGIFHYENNTANLVVQWESTDPITQFIYNLTDFTLISKSTLLESAEYMVKVDDNNVLFVIPGNFNLNPQFKIYNLQRLEFIWEKTITKVNPLTFYIAVIPLSFKIEDNKNVVDGHIFIYDVLFDLNLGTFIYHVVNEEMEEVYLNQKLFDDTYVLKSSENSICTYQKGGLFMRKVWEFEWDGKKEEKKAKTKVKFLEIFE